MESRISAIEAKQQEMVDAIMEVNSNLASIGLSTTESIKAIMEGFQSVNTALHEIIHNFTALEARVSELERRMGAMPFNSN